MTDEVDVSAEPVAAPAAPPSAAVADEMAFLNGLESVTSDDAPPLPEESAAAAPLPEEAPPVTEPPAKLRPAWVSWTDEGGFKVQPGNGLTISETGEVILAPDVIARVSSKRIAAARREERERAATQIEGALREAEIARAAMEALRTAAPGAVAAPAKPWAVKGAEKPKIDQFDDVDAWADAREEWSDAQRAPEPKAPPAAAAKPADTAPPIDDALADRVREVYEEGAGAFEDWDTVAGPVRLSDAALAAVTESDHGAELLYYLGQAPEQADKINALSGNALLRSLARIEARIELEGESNPPDTTGAGNPADAAAVHRASPVIKPVRTGASPRQDPIALAALEDSGPFFQALRDQGL